MIAYEHLRVEEITRRLKVADYGIPLNPEDRSPSPEPEYGRDGKRVNTREVRYKKKMEDERHRLILENQILNPDYKAPMDYRLPAQRYQERIMLPTELPPNTNFIGLIIGPRGNSLKELEKKTGTKIMIRGKGSSKEGKLGKDGQPMPGEDEALHALVSGNDLTTVNVAVKKIKDIIADAIQNPGNDNELKKTQLTELAKLNGTFKFEDMVKCRNCGSIDHNTWDCREQKNVTAQIRCSNCGGMGHISLDCKATTFTPQENQANMDKEYQTFRALVDKEMGITTTTADPVALPPVHVPIAQPPHQDPGRDYGSQRGRVMRGQRGRGRPGYGRGDFGGYRPPYDGYGYTGGYDRPPAPHSAVPPPNSITSEDNPGGLTLYDPSTQPKRKREWGEEGYGTYGYEQGYDQGYTPAWNPSGGYYSPGQYPGPRNTYPGYQDPNYMYQPPPPPPPPGHTSGRYSQYGYQSELLHEYIAKYGRIQYNYYIIFE
ncbi:Splicing factor 1-like [Oopsacas minuta]|uniref:Branchpoint-bridging protein n=1 Tax=Oopsacas minuta TaxID=111878 RepID=A0AAV7K7E6_9METZ|nr:Splicing factor 1-like [Oopsacas minuta]